MDLLTLQEFCEKYHYAKETVYHRFSQIQTKFLNKYNIVLTKKRKGFTVLYGLEKIEELESFSLYREVKDTVLIKRGSFSELNFEYVVFLQLLTSQMKCIRSSFTDFLKYIQSPIDNEYIKILKKTFISLEKRGFISYHLDKDDFNYFIAYINRKAETEYQLNALMVKNCKVLGDIHRVDWKNLFYVWVCVQLFYKYTPYKFKNLTDACTLSIVQIKIATKYLQESRLFRHTLAFNDYMTFFRAQKPLETKDLYYAKLHEVEKRGF